MFPSLRVAFSGLEKDAHYCVVLEMAPVSDCRYKFSGSQWVPAGGAEPQSSQRMYIHPDSPALGSHWQAQPVIFNKVKLTNNTLDSNGHVSTNNSPPLEFSFCFYSENPMKIENRYRRCERMWRKTESERESVKQKY